MPLNLDSYPQIAARIIADIANSLPDVDPTIAGSFVNALAVSNAGRHYDNVILISQLIKQLFPQTATDEYLELWAQYEGLNRLSATPGTGFITATGIAATEVPALTEFQTADNVVFSTVATATLEAKSLAVSSAVYSSGIVTITTTADHNLASGMEVTISGATETDYNGTFEILVADTDKFIYEITGTPTTPATGTVLVGFTGGSIEVEAIETGASGNLSSGAELTLTSSITGLDSSAYVQFLGLTGGADKESDDDLRSRILYSRANPVANFNVSAITMKAKEISGVTRVFVKRITPYVGAVTIAFMRDYDTNPIPDSGEVTEVYNALLEILPAQSDPSDLIVQAPTPIRVDFTFSAIYPDTLTMRQAILANLEEFFKVQATYETDIDEDKYRAIIIGTIDTGTGDSLQTFTLDSPSGDVAISTNEIGILGDINYI